MDTLWLWLHWQEHVVEEAWRSTDRVSRVNEKGNNGEWEKEETETSFFSVLESTLGRGQQRDVQGDNVTTN